MILSVQSPREMKRLTVHKQCIENTHTIFQRVWNTASKADKIQDKLNQVQDYLVVICQALNASPMDEQSLERFYHALDALNDPSKKLLTQAYRVPCSNSLVELPFMQGLEVKPYQVYLRTLRKSCKRSYKILKRIFTPDKYTLHFRLRFNKG